MKRAKYALDPAKSRGRLHPDKPEDFRSPFQRDRDRIIHSTAFRRLAYKTQVFLSHEGDLFRTRLTHSLEVAQLARALARRLRLDEDVAETVALAHDLGHPPFGHTGEDVLQEKMRNFGGFDHNAQAIRIISLREERYAGFPGLNLTWETVEGIAKHNGPMGEPLPWAMRELAEVWDLELESHASLEAQIAAISDDVAYNHHDIQDGLRSQIISDEALQDVPIIERAYKAARKAHAKAETKIIRYEAQSRFIGEMVNNIYDQIQKNLEFDPQNASDIRAYGQQIVSFSPDFFEEIQILRQFLFENLYRHQNVMAMREKASEILSRSFDYAFSNPEILPEDWRQEIDLRDDESRSRLVCDYISGMTDNYISKNWYEIHKISWDLS